MCVPGVSDNLESSCGAEQLIRTTGKVQLWSVYFCG